MGFFSYKEIPLNQRIPSIDQFRGLAILGMVLANYMGGVQLTPARLRHSPDVGLTIIDLIAPLFIFAIALTYKNSFQRRLEETGRLRTYAGFITRYLAIAGLGALISAGESVFGLTSGPDWGVLQAIGVAGLLTLIVIRLPAGVRLVLGVFILAIYQLLLDSAWLKTVLTSSHGGLFGSLAWSAMLILATVLADLFHSPGRLRSLFPWVSGVVLGAGVVLAFCLPLSKNRVSPSYVLVSLGISALLFLVFHWLSERFHWQGRFLVVWGRNPLVLYFLHYLLIGVFFLPGIPFLYAQAPLWLVLVEIAVLVEVLSLVAFWLDKRNLIISL